MKSRYLNVRELKDSERLIIKLVQSINFDTEIQTLHLLYTDVIGSSPSVLRKRNHSTDRVCAVQLFYQIKFTIVVILCVSFTSIFYSGDED